MREKYVIIPAGGTGSRMGAGIPKQMLELGGAPILRRTLDVFLALPFEVHVIIPINTSIRQMWVDYCREHNLIFKYVLMAGGVTRFHSVKNALKYVPDGALVAVHDAVRPLVPVETVKRLYEEGEEYQAVIPVMKVTDTLRYIDEKGASRIVARDGYRLVQTPQVFHSEVLRHAYGLPYSPEYTDDSSVVEKAGYPLHFSDGSRFNIKITTPEDMELAEALLGSEAAKTI